MTLTGPDLDNYVNVHRAAARNLLDYLSDRRLLTENSRSREQEHYAVASAIQMREQLSLKLEAIDNGPLRDSVISLRKAARSFINVGGSAGIEFVNDPDAFRESVADLRRVAARHVVTISEMFGLRVPDDLAGLLSLAP